MSVIKAGDRYHTLDGMRGVAALAVAAYHLEQRWHGNMIAGYLAVDLFFVISGFVIAANYSERFTRNLEFRRFMELRLIRLYPLYALGLGLGLCKLGMGYLIHVPAAASVGSVPCAATFGAAMLPDPCSSELFPLNGPSWSLFFELGINLAFAIILWRCSSLLIIVLMAFAAIMLLHQIGPPDYFNVGWAWRNFAGGLWRTIFSFSVGILLFRSGAGQRRVVTVLAALPLLVMSAILLFQAPAAYRVEIQIVAVLLIFPGLVLVGCTYELPSQALRRLCGLLGDLSYPIYSIHWPLIAAMLPVASTLHMSPVLSILTFLVALLPLAYLAACVDRVARSKVSDVLRVRRTATANIV